MQRPTSNSWRWEILTSLLKRTRFPTVLLRSLKRSTKKTYTPLVLRCRSLLYKFLYKKCIHLILSYIPFFYSNVLLTIYCILAVNWNNILQYFVYWMIVGLAVLYLYSITLWNEIFPLDMHYYNFHCKL